MHIQKKMLGKSRIFNWIKNTFKCHLKKCIKMRETKQNIKNRKDIGVQLSWYCIKSILLNGLMMFYILYKIIFISTFFFI